MPEVPERAGGGCLLLAGSVSPVTARQVEHALRSGVQGLRLDVLALLDPKTREHEVERAVGFAMDRPAVRPGRSRSTRRRNRRRKPQRATEDRELGIDPMAVGLAIAGGQAEIAAHVIAETGLNRLIVAGGDTSSAVCYRLGLERHWVLEEVQTGVPLSLSEGPQTIVTVLKSGNFGTEDFFAHALAKVRGQGDAPDSPSR